MSHPVVEEETFGPIGECEHVLIYGTDIEQSNIPISYKGVFYMRSGATNQELRGLAL